MSMEAPVKLTRASANASSGACRAENYTCVVTAQEIIEFFLKGRTNETDFGPVVGAVSPPKHVTPTCCSCMRARNLNCHDAA